MWTALVGDLADYSPNSTRGAHARKRGVARTAREMLEQLCTVQSPMFEHLPDMYNVHQCFDGHTEDGRLCSPETLHAQSVQSPQRRWYVLRSEEGPVDEESSLPPASEKAAYAVVCAQELMPAEPDITEAMTTRFNSHKSVFRKIEAAIAAMNITDDLAQAKDNVQDVLGVCMPTRPEGPVPDDCDEKLEDAHEQLTQVNVTREKAEKKFKTAMGKIAGIVTTGKAAIGEAACAEVCHGRLPPSQKKKNKKDGKGKKDNGGKGGKKKDKKNSKPGSGSKRQQQQQQQQQQQPIDVGLGGGAGGARLPSPKGSLDCLDACVADDYKGNVVECIKECNARTE